MDRARKKTEKILRQMERDIDRVYKKHPVLLKAKKKLDDYMKFVEKQTKKEYDAYISEYDQEKRKELKAVYSNKVKELTEDSKEYQKIVKGFVDALTKANQDALDVVNSRMVEVYTENYNEVATECRKVGIKVNGE